MIICVGFFLAKSSLAYDNPSGTTVGPVTTADSSINNGGTISSSALGETAIQSTGTAASININNSGTISMTGSGSTTGVKTNNNSGTTTTVTNSGAITAAFGITLRGAGDSFTNAATGNIAITNSGNGVNINNNNQTVSNNGVISATSYGSWGVSVGGGTSGATINNTNLISLSGDFAAGILVSGNAPTIITNTGTISATGTRAYGIQNDRSISTLNNAQGAGNSSGALTYTGNLPQNYNIILGSNASTYGKLAVTSATSWDGGTGTTSFGINGGIVKATKYTAVISGVTASLLTSSSLTGTYSSGGKSYAYSLALESGSSTIWDLLFPTYVEYTGPSVANTNQSLVNTASALQGTYTLQNSVLANSFSYDCNVFGANDVCVSAGGRNTQVQAANGLNNTSALLIAAYRPHPNYRVGAYADQNLSVSNPGGTVNLGNNTPLIGLFGAWNERLDGAGTEVKVSAAYGQKNTTINRSVVGSGAGASEAGSGSSTLNSQGVQATAKYGFGIMDNIIVSPYVGVRYTQNNMGGYTEGTSSSVTAPLTYSALNTNATTALAGVGASYRVMPTVTTFASAGVETDTNTANGTYGATNTSIGTLTPVNFNANPVRTRPTATVGAYYDVAKNQRFGVTGIYRQEAYQAVSTTTVMATYTIGL